MNYDWLLSFAVFAEHLNFTRAAAALHISQPALHVQVKKLAESVGVPLYRRRGRELELTAQGERVAAFGRELRANGDALVAELRGERAPGPVVLAAGQGAYLYLLGPAIRAFAARHELRPVTLAGPDAIGAVRDARAHVAVAAVDEPPAELASQVLCEVGQMVVVPTSHRLATRRRARLRDLGDEPLVVSPRGSRHRDTLARAMRAAGVPLRIAVEASGWELALHFARIGVGIAVVNDFCTVPRGMSGVPLTELPSIEYRMFWREGSRHAAATRLRGEIETRVARAAAPG